MYTTELKVGDVVKVTRQPIYVQLGNVGAGETIFIPNLMIGTGAKGRVSNINSIGQLPPPKGGGL